MISKVKFLGAILAIAGLSVMSGCLNSEVEDVYGQLTSEINAINAYLDANKAAIEANGGLIVKDPSGIAFVITEIGKELPARGDSSKVTAVYRGFLFDGTRPSGTAINHFDQGNLQNDPLYNYIQGFRYALRTWPIGSKGKVFIPSLYGYGKNGSGPSIPGNTTIVFDILDYQDVVITDKQYNQWKTDTMAIETYLKSKPVPNYDTLTYFDPNTTDPRKNMGIRYKIENPGAGPLISWFDDVKINIKYYNLSEPTTLVYQNTTGPLSLKPIYERLGMRAALLQLREGGKGTFYIPSGLMFGPVPLKDTNTQQTLFPANANIIVEIEVTDVTPL